MCVEAQYLEEDNKIKRQHDESKKASNSKGGQEKGKSQDKGKGKKKTKTTNISKKEGDKLKKRLVVESQGKF